MRLRFVITASTLAIVTGCSSSSNSTPEDENGGAGGDGMGGFSGGGPSGGSGGDGMAGNPSMGGTSMGGMGGMSMGGTGGTMSMGGAGTGGTGGTAGNMTTGGTGGVDEEPPDAGPDSTVPYVCPDEETCAACSAGSACQPEYGGDAGTGFDAGVCLNISCTVCDPGTYCEGSGTAPEPCEEGTWDDDADASTQCVAWTSCAAGTFVSTAGTETADQVCSPCATGSFTTASDQTQCTAWQDCQPGSNVTNTPSATSDRTCQACPDGTQTTGTNQPTCLSPDECAAGEEETTPATQTTPAVCEPCTAGEFCPGGSVAATDCDADSYDHDSDPSTACAPKQQCVLATQVQTSNGSTTEDRECEARTNCDAGQFETSAGDATTDRSCSPCASGSFSTATNASECTAQIDCVAGRFVTNSAAADAGTADRVCADCTLGEDYTDSANQPACLTVSNCSNGFAPSAPSTTQADQTCTDATSCLDLMTRGGFTNDGLYTIRPNGADLGVYCDMTTDGGGWTQAVSIRGVSNFHVNQADAVGDITRLDEDAKMSDADINAITGAAASDGFWRFVCDGRRVGVQTTSGTWTSAASNAEEWFMDMADPTLDGDFECDVSLDGFVFHGLGSANGPDCRAVSVGYGAPSENGCYNRLTLSWGNAGKLWIR